MSFVFKWRRYRLLSWSKVKVKGFELVSSADRMVLHLEAGGIVEIPKWSQCYCRLGQDWLLATKDKMEKEVGQTLKINGVP